MDGSKSVYGEIAIISTTSIDDFFTKQICDILKITPALAEHERFANTAIYKRIETSVRGKDVFLIASSEGDEATRVAELEKMIDAAWGANASRITVVNSALYCARQDRRNNPGEPNDVLTYAKKLSALGANRLITVDAHSFISLGMFEALGVHVDNLTAAPLFAYYINTHYKGKKIAIASPDTGGAKRAEDLLDLVKDKKAPLIIVYKKRVGKNEAKPRYVIGNPKGRTVFLYDDMIDTGGTTVKAAEALYKRGAVEVIPMSPILYLSGNATEKIDKSKIKKVIGTDILNDKTSKKIERISICPLIAEAIKRTHFDKSMRGLYGEEDVVKVYTDIQKDTERTNTLYEGIQFLFQQPQK